MFSFTYQKMVSYELSRTFHFKMEKGIFSPMGKKLITNAFFSRFLHLNCRYYIRIKLFTIFSSALEGLKFTFQVQHGRMSFSGRLLTKNSPNKLRRRCKSPMLL